MHAGICDVLGLRESGQAGTSQSALPRWPGEPLSHHTLEVKPADVASHEKRLETAHSLFIPRHVAQTHSQPCAGTPHP